MELYSRLIFPRLLELTMSGRELGSYRQSLLQSVKGQVLEIGFGTGLNLPYYSDGVTALTVVDPNQGMTAIATPRIQSSNLDITLQIASAEALPMASESFDAVVCTWTLCSILHIDQALSEVHRVLKPGGKFFFIEHGLSPEPGVSTWQRRITPLQRRVADGCHLDRPMANLVKTVFDQVELEEFYAIDLPKLLGYFYKGSATKH
ncbi:methylase involved in ubiquinone menaquinone biosynthesis [Leptolyngbya sp. Heron Island J]|uniref:class I SAM-dependent methyltransferase n=1 Tax=Leptolyngbya sp. Heron Island J TaxID=1385935 RepID=UPI0003B991E7|nr:class I SAM-dependent methyltransferase [Leptolyngbya sp. Heron Island J]ESA31980.1 methylase involved in ubiquinone menaquinone biosynthesis [Leptolyngbya sp. Heron Island J]